MLVYIRNGTHCSYLQAKGGRLLLLHIATESLGLRGLNYMPALSQLVCVSLSSTHQDGAWKSIPQKAIFRY